MPAKRRPQNKPKPATGKLLPKVGKLPDEFTGKGDEWIQGEGGGCLHFIDGNLSGTTMVPMTRRWTPEFEAASLRRRGKSGLPINAIHFSQEIPEEIRNMLSNPTLAFFTAEMIRAAHTGDAELFRRIADAVADPDSEDDHFAPGSSASILLDAVFKAAQAANGIPTIQDVGKILGRIRGADGTNRFITADRADKVRDLLRSIGFGWLPSRKQGEHLRRLPP